MPICTENGFCFLHGDWIDIIIIFDDVIIEIQLEIYNVAYYSLFFKTIVKNYTFY